MSAESTEKKINNNFLETGAFLGLDNARLYKPKKELVQGTGEQIGSVRLVQNTNSFLKHSAHLADYIQPADYFFGHEITNRTGVTLYLEDVLKTKQLVMFIFWTPTDNNETFISSLNSFFQELTTVEQVIELVLCPMDTNGHYNKHHYNFFTFHPQNNFIWQLRYMYDIKHIAGCAIVVRRTGELVTNNPMDDIGKHGIHALNLWNDK